MMILDGPRVSACSALILAAVTVVVAVEPLKHTLSCSYYRMASNCTFSNQQDCFVSTWPGTFCRDGCCRLPKSLDKLKPGFTIHGLWPNYSNATYPTCCDCPYSQHGIIRMLDGDSGLKSEVDAYWPSLKHCHFLQYEFEKHGSCALSFYDGPSGPLDYWKTAVNLRKRYDILGILMAAGIKPSTEGNPAYYSPIDEIIPALENSIGAKVVISCDENMLLEVKLCVARDNEHKDNPSLIDCPNYLRKSELSTCKRVKDKVMIPPFPKIDRPGCP